AIPAECRRGKDLEKRLLRQPVAANERPFHAELFREAELVGEALEVDCLWRAGSYRRLLYCPLRPELAGEFYPLGKEPSRVVAIVVGVPFWSPQWRTGP